MGHAPTMTASPWSLRVTTTVCGLASTTAMPEIPSPGTTTNLSALWTGTETPILVGSTFILVGGQEDGIANLVRVKSGKVKFSLLRDADGSAVESTNYSSRVWFSAPTLGSSSPRGSILRASVGPTLNLSVRFPSGEPGVVAQAWSPSSSRWRPEGREFKASLGYRVP